MQKILNVPVMWTVAQAVTETGLTDFTVRQLVKANRIHSIRLGAGKNGKILLSAESLCSYLQGNISGVDNSEYTPQKTRSSSLSFTRGRNNDF